MASLTLNNVCKRYLSGRGTPERFAVRDFSIEIGDKEFVVLVGPSGCGKSTVLQMIAGLEELSAGDIWMDGKLMNEVPPKERDIAMVFQSYALYPHMTIYENMAFALRLQKKPRAEIDQRVRAAAETLGITDYLDRMPRKLSGGEQQRVAIGRTIVRDPKIFLMDEPLSNLDAKLRNQMRAEIIQLHRQIDTTFVYVTHDQTEAMTLGDRIVVMKEGVIQQIGTPREVYDFPTNTFVASFIGTPPMNLVPGLLETGPGKELSLRLAGHRFALPAASFGAPAADQARREVVAGFRPEYTDVFWAEAPCCIAAPVTVSEMLGSELQLHIRLEGRDVVLRVPILSVPEDKRAVVPVGTVVYFRFSTEYLRLFNPETGEVIPFSAGQPVFS